ncbi:MAG: gliding motility-associated C-terminal domain-containing protein [Chitinophagaceae bacterium]|nr:gliding motility-associated C-terminal domain-containing protein [Chitinophagaceae bacterium]
MRRWFFIVLLSCCCIPAVARHVAGGELYYEYLGRGDIAASSTYKITLRLFRDCISTGPLLENEKPFVGVYENNSLIKSISMPLTEPVTTISLNTGSFPCLVGAVTVCYEVAYYSVTVVLQDNVAGYTLSRIGCCRVDSISNLSQRTNVGSNYVTRIPGSGTLGTQHNSSPQFNVRDTALVCANRSFRLDFGAVDADGDSLTYSFCDAYTSPGATNNSVPTPGLTLLQLPYAAPYNGSSPLGSRVSINQVTGIISGIAPPQGKYVVSVCITEWRNGRAFTEHRKDFILKVQDCDIIEAVLPDKIVQCKDFTVHFENQSTSSSIISYTWDFGNTGAPNNSSTNPTADYTYPDTGSYNASLHVTGPRGCQGDAFTTVIVYPGFTAAFSITGSCYQNPYLFTDATVTKYGFVNSWRWNFGDDTTMADTSNLKTASYKYGYSSTKNISLVTTSSKGCIDSVRQDLVVRDKPSLLLPFKDTLICSIDTLPIPVGNSGTVSWLPNKNIIGANTSRPLVFPKDTTRYMVTVNDNGCINTDTVTVNVLPFITVDAGKDTVICTTDTVRLRPVSYALAYQWTSSSGEIVASQKFPLVRPLVNTTYSVIANLGKCQDHDTVRIRVVKYPTAAAGPDTTICFGDRVQLRGTIKASSFSWSPAASLTSANILNPIAGPSRTTAYVLRVTDTLGCPKQVTDTVIVTVAPTVVPNAGRDTSVAPNQPLQLVATGGLQYSWTPPTGLSDPNIANPIVTLGEDVDSIKYRVRVYNSGSCFADDEVMVRVFKSGPDILVPSAFTPNGDGRNDVLRPYAIGITDFHFFKVYNRWGQLLFSTSELGKGWDGTFNGASQPSTTYVYQAEGIDYSGKRVFRKGTAVLIR